MSDVCSSKAERVTFFEDRAEVVRRAAVDLERGDQWVVIGGIGPFVDDRSVQARVVGVGVRVIAARVRRHVSSERALPSSEIERLDREHREAKQRAREAAADVVRAQGLERRGAFLLADWLAALAEVPRRTADEDRLAEWRAAYQELDAAIGSAQAAFAVTQRALSKARDEQSRAALRLAQGRVEKPRLETTIEVQLAADVGGPASVGLVYRTPCALWRPEHVARLRTDDRIEIETWATAWQATGETWEDVEARFSTARTARAATPPSVSDDVLASRRKSDWEKKRVVVEARDEDVTLAGLGHGNRAVDEMPGLDDGGEPRVFSAPGRVSIASDGRPFRVEVARATVTAQLARVAHPERSAAAHLRATATLAGGGPLLAGPVRLAREGSFVGRSRIDYVGAGEPFELGFGADDAVRVRRSMDQVRDTTALVGTQKLKRTVKVWLSNLSGEVRSVEVVERVPVSEIADVEVTVTRGDWRLEAKDGFAKQLVQLGPKETRTLTLVYEVRASSKVEMPF